MKPVSITRSITFVTMTVPPHLLVQAIGDGGGRRLLQHPHHLKHRHQMSQRSVKCAGHVRDTQREADLTDPNYR